MARDTGGFSAMGVPGHTGPYDAIVIGASFGGPPAIERVLSEMPRKFKTPIVVCQHIAPGFTEGWAERLNHVTRLKVFEAKSAMLVEPGRVYVAPAGAQTHFIRAGKAVYVRSDPDYMDSLYVPCIDYTMSSASRAFGSHLLGVLLTGLGNDGATGMLAIRAAGGYTIAESSDTAASDSMPKSAFEAGAVIETLPLPRIIERIVEFSNK